MDIISLQLKDDSEWRKKLKSGCEHIDHKNKAEKSKSIQSKKHVKNKSIIYEKLWENGLSVNTSKNRSLIKRYLDEKYKTIYGLESGLVKIIKSFSNYYNIEINYYDLLKEAKVKYKYLYEVSNE